LRLTFIRGQSAFPIPRAALLAGALLLALGIVAAALPGIENGPVVCPFRAVTGLPCPTCGLTRVAHSLMRGNLGSALAINPFDTLFFLVAMPLFAGLWVANLTGGFVVRISMSGAERRVAWGLLLAAALANWAYVLVTHR
jgi:hypothetical protein